MKVSELVEQYDLQKDISADYAYQLGYAVRRLQRYLGREPVQADLNEDTINRWLKTERDSAQLSARSRANIRRSVLTLWKFSGSVLNRDNIRSVTQTRKNPEAWELQQLFAVIEAAEQLPGVLTNGVPRGLYMSTLLWFAFETGLRRSDIWSFDVTTFDEHNCAAVTQHKTQRVHLVQITDETVAGIKQIQQYLKSSKEAMKTPLQWPQAKSQFYRWMKRCRKEAGVDSNVRNRSLQHIRRTGATEVEVQGGTAWKFLGHAAEGIDRKSYIDARKTMAPITPMRKRPNASEPAVPG